MSLRALKTEEDLIDDVVESYTNVPGMTSLAVGCPYWTPPKAAIEETFKLKDDPSIHRYSSVSGMTDLKQEISRRLLSMHLDISDMSIIVTNGANQGFLATMLAICDPGDDVVLLCPHYAYHKAALQLASVNIHLSPFDAAHRPHWRVLETMITTVKPKAIVVTNPSNPAGTVLTMEEMQDLVNMAKTSGAYLIVDQVYQAFVYSDIQTSSPTSSTAQRNHVIPCSAVFHYDRIIHLFSFSKEFGMCGWRVGYVACPSHLEAQYKKIQDIDPVHPSIFSQHLAMQCLRYDGQLREEPGSTGGFITPILNDLMQIRETFWGKIKLFGALKPEGAFYFLLPLPNEMGDMFAVEVLAKQFQVLVVPGSMFGAPGHIRISYGGIRVAEAEEAADKLARGLAYLYEMQRSV